MTRVAGGRSGTTTLRRWRRCAATLVAGFAVNVGPLVVIGVLSFVGGLATFGAFLQRVIKPGGEG